MRSRPLNLLRSPAFKDCLAAAPLLLCLSAYYAFVVTSGKFGPARGLSQYYELAADGFRHGHLYLAAGPRPQLLAQANPFDLVHRKLWLWDILLFDGHYYIYWGPVPALCLLGFKLVTGYAGKLHDQWLVLLFMLGRLYAGAALILSFASWRRERPPRWAVLLAVAVFALASPTTYVLARPVIYEASIAAGQCFLFWGLLAAFWGFGTSRLQTLLFVVAGLLWGMALGSRITLSLVVPVWAVLTALFAWRGAGYAWRPGLRALLAVGLPVGLSGLACLYYNHARFGSWTDFGLAYQLTRLKFKTDPAYLMANLVTYFGAQLAWSCHFPFVTLPVSRSLPAWIEWPPGYDVGPLHGERAAGMFVTTTFLWLLAAWLWPALRASWHAFRHERRSCSIVVPNVDLWLLSCSLSVVLSLGPALFMYLSVMRYVEDAIGGLLIGATLAGLWWIRRTARSPASALARTLYVALAAHTIVVGLCLGFTGHNDNFQRENRALFRTLVERYSVCK
jgi:hypothetical protein